MTRALVLFAPIFAACVVTGERPADSTPPPPPAAVEPAPEPAPAVATASAEVPASPPPESSAPRLKAPDR